MPRCAAAAANARREAVLLTLMACICPRDNKPKNHPAAGVRRDAEAQAEAEAEGGRGRHRAVRQRAYYCG